MAPANVAWRIDARGEPSQRSAQAVGKNASSAAPRIAPPKNQGSASASRPMKLSKTTSKLIQYVW
jgi:hypothetical protein